MATTHAARATPPTYDDRVRARVRDWINKSGQTQAAVGEAIGKNQAWISRYLSGEVYADLDMLQRIAAVFDHTLFALLDLPGGDPVIESLIAKYRALPPDSRELIDRLLDEFRPRRHGGRRS